MKLLLKKVPTYLLILSFIITGFATYAFTSRHYKNLIENTPTPNFTTNVASNCSFKINRLKGRKFIKPLLYAERTCEAEDFSTIKTEVNNLITQLKSKEEIKNASVYIRLFSKGEWLSINEDTRYQPGSLFKVPLLITYLRYEEQHPGFLDKKLIFNFITPQAKQFTQAFVKNSIQFGKTYSIRELFKYMIAHSDNNATMLLFNNISPLEFEKTFTDLGLDKNMTKSDGVISAAEYSKFWITLYNGSYLNFDNSEFALKLLSESDFVDGMIKGIPKDVMVAHKFGEKGNGKEYCLHETGIVYANDKPYLVTVMTNGYNQKTLTSCLQQISSTVYNNIVGFTK